MNTLRNELKEKYSQIPNELIIDLSLCHGSLRVLLYLFTKPDSWNVYNKDICKQLGISEQTLTKYWKKLLSSKWLRREQSRNDKGNLTGGYTYRIGNFTVSIQSTETVESIEHSNNKPINKKVTNKAINENHLLKNFIKEFIDTKKIEQNISDDTVLDFIKYRKQIGASIKTANPIAIYIRALIECVTVGKYEKNLVIQTMKEKEWKSLKLEWIENTLKHLKNGKTKTFKKDEFPTKEELETITKENLRKNPHGGGYN